MCRQDLRSITNNWTGHASYYLLIIWDSRTLSNWNLFWNQLKNEQLQTKNYNAKSNISF